MRCRQCGDQDETVQYPMANSDMVWTANPQDFSKGQGGFEGGYFCVRGVTDREFDSLEEICAVMDRRKNWRKVTPMSGFDAMYQWHDGRPKWVGITRQLRRIR